MVGKVHIHVTGFRQSLPERHSLLFKVDMFVCHSVFIFSFNLAPLALYLLP